MIITEAESPPYIDRKWTDDAPSVVLYMSNGSRDVFLSASGPIEDFLHESGGGHEFFSEKGTKEPAGIYAMHVSIVGYQTYGGDWDVDIRVDEHREATDEEIDAFINEDHLFDVSKYTVEFEVPEREPWDAAVGDLVWHRPSYEYVFREKGVLSAIGPDGGMTITMEDGVVRYGVGIDRVRQRKP